MCWCFKGTPKGQLHFIYLFLFRGPLQKTNPLTSRHVVPLSQALEILPR